MTHTPGSYGLTKIREGDVLTHIHEGYSLTHAHDMVAAPIHLSDPILALWALQYSIFLQVPAQMCTHTDVMQLILTCAVEHLL